MAHILGIETGRGLCSAALYRDGILHEATREMERAHNEHILGLVDAVVAAGGLKPRELDAVAFGCGPGSFTGVRMAAAVAQGAALGADAGVVPISSTRALAAAAMEQLAISGGLLVSIRSRKDLYYLASFVVVEGQLTTHRADELLGACPDWTDAVRSWPLVGDQPPWLSGLTEACSGVVVGAGLIARLGAEAFAEGRALVPELALPTYVAGDTPWRPA